MSFVHLGRATSRNWARRIERMSPPGHHPSGEVVELAVLAERPVGSALGDVPAYRWVAQGNERAIAFYRRQGFVEDGAQADDQHDGITELRMVRAADRARWAGWCRWRVSG